MWECVVVAVLVVVLVGSLFGLVALVICVLLWLLIVKWAGVLYCVLWL